MEGLIYLVVIGTSIFVAVDASNLGVKKGSSSGFFDMGPVGWFFACLLLWIVAFPVYLSKRSEYKQLKESMAAGVAIPTPGYSQPGSPEDIPGQLKKLHDLNIAGALSNEEFAKEKSILLSRQR